MMTTRTLRSLAALSCSLLAALAAPRAYAQATIDQTKALAGNVTPGDTAGFPITLSQPGSYKLMSNLYVPAGVGGIAVTADNVSIDLNGFTIQGPNTCKRNTSTSAVTCTSTYNQGVAGVYIKNASNTVVRNGTIRGFADGAIAGENAPNMQVDGVHLQQSGAGLLADNYSPRAMVSNSSAWLNAHYGFRLESGVASKIVAAENGGPGVDLGNNNTNSVLMDALVQSNAGGGVSRGSVRCVSSSGNKGGNFLNSKSLGCNLNDGVSY